MVPCLLHFTYQEVVWVGWKASEELVSAVVQPTAHKHISTFQSQLYAGCLSHEPSLVALAPSGVLQLSVRASGLVARGSQVRFQLGLSGVFLSNRPCH